MASEAHVSFVGNLTSAPELRFTQSGKAVATVTVAVNRKRGDEDEADFHRVTIWEKFAEHAAQLEKGTRVIVIGRLTSKQYETREGEKRTGWEVAADAFGPDLRFTVVSVTKTPVRGGDGQSTANQEPWATEDDGTPF